jgi:hypothetical protein
LGFVATGHKSTAWVRPMGKPTSLEEDKDIMTAMTKFLIACTSIVLPLAASMVPLTAAAQSADAAYCKVLSDTVRNTIPKSQSPTVSVPVAIAKCEAGDTTAGIPVLEQALRNAQVTLPSRS